MHVTYAGWCAYQFFVSWLHRMCLIKHSSFHAASFRIFVRLTHVGITHVFHVTSLGDLGLGDFAGLDSGLDS